MKIFLDSFVNLCLLSVLLLQVAQFIKNSFSSPPISRNQRILQLFFVFSLFFMIFYQFQLLKTIYSEKIIDTKDRSMPGKLKVLQYTGENTLHTLLCHSLGVMIGAMEHFKVSSIKDQTALKYAAFSYAYARSVPVLIMMSWVFDNPPFYSILVEILMAGEALVISLIFAGLVKVLRKVTMEIDAFLMMDKSAIQYLLFVFKTISSKVCAGLFLEAFSRLIYLVVALGDKSKLLMLASDISSFLKLVSTYLILTNLVELMFADCGSFRMELNEHEKDKFFIFDESEESESKKVELKCPVVEDIESKCNTEENVELNNEKDLYSPVALK